MRKLVILAAVLALAGCGSAAANPPTGAAPSQSANPVAKATKPPKPKPHLIAVFHGNGDANTRRFKTPATWFIKYRYDCSGFGSSGNFIVNENGKITDTNVSVNGLAATGHGRSYAHFDPGRHFLGILSECSWKTKVYS